MNYNLGMNSSVPNTSANPIIPDPIVAVCFGFIEYLVLPMSLYE